MIMNDFILLWEIKDYDWDRLYLGPVDDEADRPSVQQQQQRPTNPSTPTASTQAMRIILEEDENSDSPPSE